MAITNIHPITSTVNFALNYIKRDKFTLQDNKMLRSKTITSCMNCVKDNDFELFCKQRQYYLDNGHSIKLRNDGKENLAFHMVQSFDEKIDPVIANEIGRKLAEELLSEYSCVISTHSDSDYTHNHFIFNAYKMDGSGKWNDCDKTKDAIRKVSDRLCEEYGLSVLDEHRDYKPIHWKDKNGRSRSYEPSERKEKLRKDRISTEHNSFDLIQKKINRSLKKDQSFTESIKRDIDDTVKIASSYDNMIQLLIKKGYTIQSKKKDGNWLKYISFKAPDGEKPIRDSSLGSEYSRGNLTEKIMESAANRNLMPKSPVTVKDYIQADTNAKFQNVKTLRGQQPTKTNNSKLEYLKNCIDANLAALNTIEKYGVLTLPDFKNRLETVAVRTDLLNTQFSDLQKRMLKISGLSSIIECFDLFENDLYKLQRKYSLLQNFFGECSGCITTLQRVNRENKNILGTEVKNIGLFTSKCLVNISKSQAFLSNIIEKRIYRETKFPLINSLSVMQLSSLAKMKSHADYTAAKAGDSGAAFRLVNDLLKGEEQQIKIKELGQKYPDAIIIGVLAEETAGKNKIPFYLAKKINEMTGIEYDRGITQINKVGRTNSSAAYRLAHRPKFGGKVQAGRKYILVDDAITAGGTLSELRSYIESRGGEVVHLVTGGAAANSTNFALSNQTRFDLESKHGIIPLMNFVRECDIYGGRLEYLTESEASELLRFKSLDAVRNRIAEERHGRSRQDFRRAERNRIPENSIE